MLFRGGRTLDAHPSLAQRDCLILPPTCIGTMNPAKHPSPLPSPLPKGRGRTFRSLGANLGAWGGSWGAAFQSAKFGTMTIQKWYSIGGAARKQKPTKRTDRNERYQPDRLRLRGRRRGRFQVPFQPPAPIDILPPLHIQS